MLTVAARRGCPAACLLVVSDTAPGAGERIGDEELETAALRLGRAALDALVAAGH